MNIFAHPRRGILLAMLLLAGNLTLPAAPALATEPGTDAVSGLPGLPGISAPSAPPAHPYIDMGVTRPGKSVAAPPFTLPTPDGGTIDLAAHAGDVVMVNFWATWCIPCRKEMPALQALWERHQPQGMQMIAVNVDRGSARGVVRFLRKKGLTLPVGLDRSGDVRRSYEVIVLPVTYLVGRDGRLIGKAIGDRDWDSDAAHVLVESLLAPP